MGTPKYVVHVDTGTTWRGGQNQVYILARGLKDYPIRQLLLSPQGSPLSQRFIELDIPVEDFSPSNDLDISQGLKLRKLIKKESPDIIHFHTSRGLGVGCWALRSFRAKSVFTKRVDFPISANPVNRFKYSFPGVTVVISDFIRNQMEEQGYVNVKKIYSCVDIADFNLRKNYGDREILNVAMLGAFDLKHKDFITFIKAADRLLGKNEKLRFLIAGQGTDENKIRRLIKKLNHQNEIKIIGFVKDVKKFLDSIDIIAHTVHFEGLGTVILQAMACGIPVVATNTGGIPEIVKDGENGFLVDKCDYEMTADRILKLAGDTGLREKMGQKGFELAGKFSATAMVKSYFDLYQSL